MIQPRQLTSSALRYKRVERGAALLQEWLQTTHDLEGTHFAGALYSAVGKYSRPLTEAGREKWSPSSENANLIERTRSRADLLISGET
jgi:hypothetical protein